MTNPVRKIVYAVLGALFPGATGGCGLLPGAAGPIADSAGGAAASPARSNKGKPQDHNGIGVRSWIAENSDKPIKAPAGAAIALYDRNGSGAQKWAVSNGTTRHTESS